jgi:hypothetical protein
MAGSYAWSVGLPLEPTDALLTAPDGTPEKHARTREGYRLGSVFE